MLKHIETEGGEVLLEIDPNQGRIHNVICPDHGSMPEALQHPRGWVCTGDSCTRRLSQDEAMAVRQQLFDEIKSADRKQRIIDQDIQQERLSRKLRD